MAITDPRDIPGLILWLSADAITGLADGATVHTWTSLDDAATVATGAGTTKPSYDIDAGAAGGPAVYFDSNDYFTLPAILSGATGGEIHATFKSQFTSGPQQALFQFTDADLSFQPYSDGKFYENFGRNSRTSFTPSLAITSWRRYNVWSGAGAWSARLDEQVQATETTHSVSFRTSTCYLGSNTNQSGKLQGWLGCVVVYDRMLTTTERDDLTAWLTANPSGGNTGGGPSGDIVVPIGQVTIPVTAQPVTTELAVTVPGESRNRGAGIGQLGGVGRVSLTVPVSPVPAHIAAAQGTAVEKAFSLPPITLVDGRPKTNPVPAMFEQPAKRFRIVVNGRDITYFRGVRTPVPSYKLTEPYSYGATRLEFPQIHPAYEVPGTGDHAWLEKGREVRFDLVDRDTNEVVKEGVYRGVIIGRQAGTSAVDVGGPLSGRAAFRYRPVPTVRRVWDLGRWFLNAANNLSIPSSPRKGVVTGIEVPGTGGMWYQPYLDNLLALSTQADGSQWTAKFVNGAWTLVQKDRTTIHATAWLDGARVVADLTEDEEANAYYLTGIGEDGRRITGRIDPGMIQGEVPEYPFTDGRSFGLGTTNAGTDTGDGVYVMHSRLNGMGYLSFEDWGTEYDAATVDAVNALRADAHKPLNGTMTTSLWESLFDLSITRLTFGQSRIEPMVIDDRVRPRDLTSSGAIAGRNALFDPKVLRVDREVDMGPGMTPRRMRRWARADMERTRNAWTGTITLHTDVFAGKYAHGDPDPVILSKFELEAGQNLWVPNFQPTPEAAAAGGTLFHIGYIDPDPKADVARLSVDIAARDAVDLAAVKARNREARRNPAAEWLRQHRASKRTNDRVTEWEPRFGRVFEKIRLDGNRWNVFPVLSGQEGTVARIRLALGNDEAAFVMAVFGRRIGRGVLAKRIGNPFKTDADGESRWTNESLQDWLHDERLCVYVAGDAEQPCGYWPKQHTDADGETDHPVTGKWQADAGFGYRTFKQPWLWVAVYPDRDCVIAPQRVMWDQLEPGT